MWIFFLLLDGSGFSLRHWEVYQEDFKKSRGCYSYSEVVVRNFVKGPGITLHNCYFLLLIFFFFKDKQQQKKIQVRA